VEGALDLARFEEPIADIPAKLVHVATGNGLVLRDLPSEHVLARLSLGPLPVEDAAGKGSEEDQVGFPILGPLARKAPPVLLDLRPRQSGHFVPALPGNREELKGCSVLVQLGEGLYRSESRGKRSDSKQRGNWMIALLKVIISLASAALMVTMGIRDVQLRCARWLSRSRETAEKDVKRALS